MNPIRFQLSDRDRSDLRILVWAIDRELACLALDATAAQHAEAKRNLALCWALLLQLLAIDSAPEPPARRRRHVCMSPLCDGCARPPEGMLRAGRAKANPQ